MSTTILKLKCPVCNKLAQEKSHIECKRGTDDVRISLLTCGHSLTQKKVDARDSYEITSIDGFNSRHYQTESIKFARDADLRCLIGHEQGLGKTVIGCGIIKLFESDVCPCLIVCKAGLIYQIYREVIRWCGPEFMPQILRNSKDEVLPGFKVYIVSYDLLRRMVVETEREDQEVSLGEGASIHWKPKKNKLALEDFKSVWLDECQQIKNTGSKRTQQVRSICKDVPHIWATSGTPIRNNAAEYFTILNLIRPEMFPEYARFIQRECQQSWTGYGYKVGGLRRPEEFHEKTKDFIIRYTRQEVEPDLPLISREFFHADMEDRKFNEAYRKAQKEFEKLYYSDDEGPEHFTNLLAMMARMRHLVGLAKVDHCLDFLTDFLLTCDRKIVVFVHHKDVHQLLSSAVDSFLTDGGMPKTLNLTSDISAEDRQRTIDNFKNNGNRILIASTQAAGEGLNMQFCSDAIMLERQWNPAHEEQAEGRFIRIGQEANKVSCTYILASGTIDEYFTEIVEKKRAIVKSTLDNEQINWDSQSLMMDLAQTIAVKGSKKWSL